MRVFAGVSGSNQDEVTTMPQPIFAGDVPWVAPQQANKVPYKGYTDFSDKITKLAKDYTIVPEFRASTLMRTYLNDKSGDFTAEIPELFNLTGADNPNSSESEFYTIYSNADFLKYFKFIDEDLNEKRSGDLKILRDKIELSCDAYLKFLPYKGFYPAERTLELSTLFSQSLGDNLLTWEKLEYGILNTSTFSPDCAAQRIVIEPLFAPGIMFNTIKSGIAV